MTFNSKEYYKKYIQTHREEAKLACKKYRQNNKEKLKKRRIVRESTLEFKEKRKLYRQIPYVKEKEKECQKKYRSTPEYKELSRMYELKNKTKRQKQARIWRELNKEKISKQEKEYNSRPDVKKRVKEYSFEKRLKQKIQVYNHYSNYDIKCNCCGEKQIEFLTLDHINNDGSQHKKENNISGGHKMREWIIKNNFPPGFQILCWNCNCAKGVDLENICPHQRQKEIGRAHV